MIHLLIYLEFILSLHGTKIIAWGQLTKHKTDINISSPRAGILCHLYIHSAPKSAST